MCAACAHPWRACFAITDHFVWQSCPVIRTPRPAGEDRKRMIANRDGGDCRAFGMDSFTSRASVRRRSSARCSWIRRSNERTTGCSPDSTTMDTGSPSWKATRFSSRNICCFWRSWVWNRTRSVRGMARYIQDHQLEDGGWAIYPGGPTDVSASVKAYFALKLTGIDPEDPAMAARSAGDSSGRRGARVQQLHAVLPRASGPDQLRRLPVRSAGARADSGAIEFQPERDVGVDAYHRRSAFDHVVF